MDPKVVFVSTYTFIKNGIRTNASGPVIPLRCYFWNKKVDVIFFLEQPLPGSDDLRVILTEMNLRLPEKKFIMQQAFLFGKDISSFDSNKTYFRLKFRDLISNFWALFKIKWYFRKDCIDIFIGVESINAICGIIFKKLGLVKKVIYYIFDWAPRRYHNLIINKIYLFLDRLATYHADATWNITYTISEARRNILNYDQKKMSLQIYVPYSPGVFEKYLRSEKDIDSDLIVYAGGLIRENGPHLLLEAFRIVLNKYFKAKLLIIGGGELEEELYTYIRKWNLEKAVTLTGYIPEEEKVINLQSKGVIGTAPYPVMRGSRKPFGDVIKIRMYFACGLVPVSTPVPPVAKEIVEEKLGIVTLDDSPEEFAKGILELLRDKERLFVLRRNVIDKARKTSWENTYTSAFMEMKICFKRR